MDDLISKSRKDTKKLAQHQQQQQQKSTTTSFYTLANGVVLCNVASFLDEVDLFALEQSCIGMDGDKIFKTSLSPQWDNLDKKKKESFKVICKDLSNCDKILKKYGKNSHCRGALFAKVAAFARKMECSAKIHYGHANFTKTKTDFSYEWPEQLFMEEDDAYDILTSDTCEIFLRWVYKDQETQQEIVIWEGFWPFFPGFAYYNDTDNKYMSFEFEGKNYEIVRQILGPESNLDTALAGLAAGSSITVVVCQDITEEEPLLQLMVSTFGFFSNKRNITFLVPQSENADETTANLDDCVSVGMFSNRQRNAVKLFVEFGDFNAIY